ncbi:hypothetical protein E2493_06690 [Sphingomonas parva]|uniref:Tyrosine specific protein phosphatases domain-containing protein n=1 Tax=Sphingomonas parva TaxID=2555898 RepID=A0A4Y8ZV60_9SPHN|nr:dual specificity protein phosphatase family protein [Sphingomonas parva]TFI59202.1 hypothetical protein E2493_06690 [Sphingomonas parva]
MRGDERVELRIESAERALALLKQGWPTKAVSLVGEDLRFPLPQFGSSHLILRFHDVEAEDEPGFVPPTQEQLRLALAHAADLAPSDRLLIHCHAGKSRSPAVAIGILIQLGMTPLDAFTCVKGIRPQLIPNRLIIRQLDEILGLKGELISIVRRHYQGLGSEAALPNRGGMNR